MDFKAVREGTALLVDDTARRADGEGPIGKLKLRVAVFDHFPPHSPLAGDSRRHAEQEADEVGVVNVQVDKRPADLPRIVEVLEPKRIGNDALEMTAEELAVLAAGDEFSSVHVFGQKRQDVADENLPAGF